MHLSLILLASLTLTYLLPLSLSYQDGARSESCYNMLVMHANFSEQVAPPIECGNPCQYNLSVVAKVEIDNTSLYFVDEGTPTTYQCGGTYLCEWSIKYSFLILCSPVYFLLFLQYCYVPLQLLHLRASWLRREKALVLLKKILKKGVPFGERGSLLQTTCTMLLNATAV